MFLCSSLKEVSRGKVGSDVSIRVKYCLSKNRGDSGKSFGFILKFLIFLFWYSLYANASINMTKAVTPAPIAPPTIIPTVSPNILVLKQNIKSKIDIHFF